MEFEAYRLYVLSTLKGIGDTNDLECKLKQIWDITQKHLNNGFCDIKHAVHEVCTTFDLDIPSFSSNVQTSLDVVQQQLPSNATTETLTLETSPLETAPLETSTLEAVAAEAVAAEAEVEAEAVAVEATADINSEKSSINNLIEQYITSGKTESEIKGFMDAIKLLKIDC